VLAPASVSPGSGAGSDLADPARARFYNQVIGDREFSSGHPAMQALNPFVYEIWLEYQE